jgi:hypothetical protein
MTSTLSAKPLAGSTVSSARCSAGSMGRPRSERFLDAQAGAPENDDHRSHAPAVTVMGRVAHDRHDLIDRWWVGRVAHALVAAGGRRGARQRRR